MKFSKIAFGAVLAGFVFSGVASAVEAPSVRIGSAHIIVTSMDNGTIVENVVLNRGNCEVKFATRDYEKHEAFKSKYPELLNKKGQLEYLYNKSGEKVEYYFFLDTSNKDMEFFNSLSEESKGMYKLEFPSKEINFGEEKGFGFNSLFCKVLEVELTVNGKKYKYNMR